MKNKKMPAAGGNQSAGSSNNSQNHFNSSQAQRQRIIEFLRLHRRMTTLQARSQLDILHPAGRVRELRVLGYDIRTLWRDDYSQGNRKHRVAQYVLVAEARVA